MQQEEVDLLKEMDDHFMAQVTHLLALCIQDICNIYLDTPVLL